MIPVYHSSVQPADSIFMSGLTVGEKHLIVWHLETGEVLAVRLNDKSRTTAVSFAAFASHPRDLKELENFMAIVTRTFPFHWDMMKNPQEWQEFLNEQVMPKPVGVPEEVIAPSKAPDQPPIFKPSDGSEQDLSKVTLTRDPREQLIVKE